MYRRGVATLGLLLSLAAFGDEGGRPAAQPRQATRSIAREARIPTVRDGSRRFDINRMSESDFVALGFPKGASHNIINYRYGNDGFNSVDDLIKVPGVNGDMIDPVRGRLAAGPRR